MENLCAPTGGEHVGRNPSDHGKLGCKYHLLADQRGLPLATKILAPRYVTRTFLFHSLKLFKRLKGFAAVRVNVQISCTLIGHTLREHLGPWLRRRGVATCIARTVWSPEKGSADGGGLLSAPWDGYTAFADCASGTSGEQTSIRRFFRLLAHSSVGGMSNRHVRRTKY